MIRLFHGRKDSEKLAETIKIIVYLWSTSIDSICGTLGMYFGLFPNKSLFTIVP